MEFFRYDFVICIFYIILELINCIDGIVILFVCIDGLKRFGLGLYDLIRRVCDVIIYVIKFVIEGFVFFVFKCLFLEVKVNFFKLCLCIY